MLFCQSLTLRGYGDVQKVTMGCLVVVKYSDKGGKLSRGHQLYFDEGLSELCLGDYGALAC